MMPLQSTANLDWEKRILAGESIIPFETYNQSLADEAWEILKELKVVDALRQPTIGESHLPWLRQFCDAIFGSYDIEAEEQIIKEILLLISKKNSKSSTAAGIMLTLLILNTRASAEFLILAPTIEVANNSYQPARDMIKADPELERILKVQDHVRTITDIETGSTLKVVAAESDSVSGKKASVVLVDELWLFGSKPNAENMLREATGGLASRPEGFVIYLTTQSDKPPAGVFRTKLEYARKVRDGKTNDPYFLPVLYEFPQSMIKDKSYLEQKYFKLTNPNMGLSVSETFLIRELAKAQEDGDESLIGFLAKHLNIEIDMNLRNDRWVGADFWSDCATDVTLARILEESDAISIGIDGGGLDDLYGLAVIGRHAETQRWMFWTHAWAHPIVLKRRKAQAPRFKGFEKDGDLTLVKEIGDDMDDIVATVSEVDDSGLLVQIGIDQHGLASLVEALIDAQIDEDKIIGISQGWKMMSAIKTVERRLADKSAEHDGSMMMKWCVGNARTRPVGNAVMITKQESGPAKIDPLMALFDAASIMAQNPEGVTTPQVYNLEDV
ncbi:terminase large subunit [Photobacterium indicum]|uniref:Terminase n=1 Tax=Photobacterium indicum TaxID=81447 RepID=A0A2T3LAH3_9GAMM|nr:terminase TerL endonuclease subunit [Photobacterium indicum]PSV48328.1 terminase [Photobacterium indicum]